MKKIVSIIIFIFTFLSSCEKIDKDSPDCLRDKIGSFAKSPTCESEASIGQGMSAGRIEAFEQFAECYN